MLSIINQEGNVVDIEQLSKRELDLLLRDIADKEGQDMLIAYIWPLVERLKKLRGLS